MVAAAKAATQALAGEHFLAMQQVALPDQKESLIVPVTSAALLDEGKQAIGITYADSGIGLDITRGLEVWACVQLDKKQEVCGKEVDSSSDSWLKLVAGVGVGTNELSGDICLSSFARDLFKFNLRALVPKGQLLRVEIVFPNGKELAQRTSNKAFGIVDGLALIGTQAEAQISASPEQLQNTIALLRSKCETFRFNGSLTFVIGENGLALAQQVGLSSKQILKVGNWLGPLLVAAAESGVKSLLILGYHGKLIKLAGGIFHTHHHLADGRIEVLTALAVAERIPFNLIEAIAHSSSVEEAFLRVECSDPELAQKLWRRAANRVERRSHTYVKHYGSWPMEIGAALFDRQRRIRWTGPVGDHQLNVLGVALDRKI